MARRPRIIKIETPRGKVIINEANMKAELIWKPGFVDEREESYTEAQKFVDSEVIRLSEPYTPLLTGMLIKSSILGTFIGSGEVAWIAPYARPQYYLKRVGTETGNLRGWMWFERMKEAYGHEIIKGARIIAGGKK